MQAGLLSSSPQEGHSEWQGADPHESGSEGLQGWR